MKLIAEPLCHIQSAQQLFSDPVKATVRNFSPFNGMVK